MPNSQSPKWNRSTKVIAIVTSMILVVLTLWYFSYLIQPLIIAGIIAYLLNPIVDWIDDRIPLTRGPIIVIAYLIIVGLLVWLFSYLGITVYQQVVALIDVLPVIIEGVPQVISEITSRTYNIGTFTFRFPNNFNFEQLTTELSSLLQPMLTNTSAILQTTATSTASIVTWTIFTLVISFYATKDLPQLSRRIGNFADGPGYRRDADLLMRDFGQIWSKYLRGQATLALVMGIVVSVLMLLFGVRYSLALGLLAGVLEFVPYVGPLISVGAMVGVALFQGTNIFGLDPLTYAFLILGVGVVIQQIENSVLVPRIVGDALDLHPITVMVVALMGATLAGLLGVMLSAPVAATVKLVGNYVWSKLLDLEPFPDDVVEEEKETFFASMRRRFGIFGRRRRNKVEGPVETPVAVIEGEVLDSDVISEKINE